MGLEVDLDQDQDLDSAEDQDLVIVDHHMVDSDDSVGSGDEHHGVGDHEDDSSEVDGGTGGITDSSHIGHIHMHILPGDFINPFLNLY